MAPESKYRDLLSKVHEGVPLEKSVHKSEVTKLVENEANNEVLESMPTPIKVSEPPAKPTEKRRRKSQGDYQSQFFNRIDLTHRKPLYITATTHRRLMRIVHLMDESKATIGSYVENIVLNHLETFKEEIDAIYQTNNTNPAE